MKSGDAGEQEWPEQWQNGEDECDLWGSLIVISSAPERATEQNASICRMCPNRCSL